MASDGFCWSLLVTVNISVSSLRPVYLLIQYHQENNRSMLNRTGWSKSEARLRKRSECLSCEKWQRSNAFSDPQLYVLCVCAKSLQLCLTLRDPIDYSSPSSSIYEILQARILEWVAISFSRGSSPPRDQTQISYISSPGRWFLYH